MSEVIVVLAFKFTNGCSPTPPRFPVAFSVENPTHPSAPGPSTRPKKCNVIPLHKSLSAVARLCGQPACLSSQTAAPSLLDFYDLVRGEPPACSLPLWTSSVSRFACLKNAALGETGRRRAIQADSFAYISLPSPTPSSPPLALTRTPLAL
jgi:hypothetical protein